MFSHNMDSKLIKTHDLVKMPKITEEKLLVLFYKLIYLLKMQWKAESVYHPY